MILSGSGVQWWCSASGQRWTWHWRAYPGIWIVVCLVALWVRRRVRALTGPGAGWRRACAIAGAAILWITLDWPAGPLGTGYLASVHAVQFIILAMVIPPLLLVAADRRRRDATPTRGLRVLARRAGAAITQPVLAAVLFTVIMGATHAPVLVDTLMRWQLGAFLLDMLWLGSGIVFWWPVVLVRRPERPWFVPGLRMLYLFFGTQAHLIIAMWLLSAEFPVYSIYELAPRVVRLSAVDDQQLAGAIMIALAEPLVLAAISIVFFRWFGRPEPPAPSAPRLAGAGTA